MALSKVLVNGVSKTVLKYQLKKEGDRAIDQSEVTFPYGTSIVINDEIIIMQDYVDLTNLQAAWTFQNSLKDESSNGNHGTGTDISYDFDQWGGKTAVFNGTSSVVTVTDSNYLDLSNQFDISLWVKWTVSTSDMTLISKRSSGSDGWSIQVNTSTDGDIKFNIGSNSIVSSTDGYNDSSWHFIRIKRDSDNLITLYVDNVSKGTLTDSTDLTDTNDLRIGRDHTSDYFDGYISRIRIYNSIIEDSEATKLYTKANPRTIMKFGGFVTKIDDEVFKQKVISQSFGKILADTEIRGEVYDNQTPEYIMEDLITKNTEFEFLSRGASSNLILTKYHADGKLIDIVRNFSSLTNKVFYTTSNKQFVFEPAEHNATSISKIHGTNSLILENGYDDTEIVNDLTVLGENLRYHTIETFSVSSANSITLENGATSINVKNGATELSPEIDYELDIIGKKVTFTTPQTGTITADYEYEKPLYIRGKRQSSIDTYGLHAKRLSAPWISNRSDGVRFVQGYLERYKDITRKIKVEIGEHDNFLNENDLVFLTSSPLSINSESFAVKSITWRYPEMNTEINAGEYFFDYLEYDKQIVEKLHNVEGAITTIKDVRDYESPELILGFNFTATELITELHQQTLNMSELTVIYEKSKATYGSSTYGSRVTGDIYGS